MDEWANGRLPKFESMHQLNRLTRCPRAGRAEVLGKGIAIGRVFAYAQSLKV